MSLLRSLATVLAALGLFSCVPGGASPRAIGGAAAAGSPASRERGRSDVLPPLRVLAVDVGQGDALLVLVGEGAARKAILIDGGPPEGAENLLAALRAADVRALDWLVITHAHLDHIGGLPKVLDAIPVRAVLEPGVPHTTTTYRRLLQRLLAEKEAGRLQYRVARRGLVLPLGEGTRLEVLAPEEPLLRGTRSDVNANSVVVRLVHGAVRFLLTGDAEDETEARLLAGGADLSAEVLKVAHHGSRHASSARWLAKVRPRIALVSCGRENRYGHPSPEALERLAAVGVATLRTDREGTIVLTSDGADVRRLGAALAAPGAPRGPPSVESEPTAPKRAPPSGTPVVASRRGRVYHAPDCAAAERIAPRNRIEFARKEDAEASGRRPHACVESEGGGAPR